MSAKTTTARKAGSAARGPRGLERLLIVAAVAAVLVAVGAWYAMNRPGGGAEAAGARSSVTSSGGASADSASTDAATASTTDTAAGAGAGAGAGDQGAATTSSAPQSAAAGSQDSTGTAAAPSSAASAPLSPTTAFLTALTASGLAPPVDDAQKLAMADDVCQELGYGSTYADVVRALTFAGASDTEAANFARLAITNICPQYTAR